MQYNKGTRAEALTRRRSARQETGNQACVTSFGLPLGRGGGEEGGGGRSKKQDQAEWTLLRHSNVTFQDGRRAARAD